MIRSLAIKLLLLAGTLGCIFGLNWSTPDRVTETHPSKIEEAAKNFSKTNQRNISGGSNSKSFDKKAIDLNLSTAQELEALPGIGSTLAKRIIDHRRQVGSFQSIQSLEEVKGIGKKKLQTLSPLLMITSSVVAKKS